MNPLFRIDFSISDSLKIVRKSVLIYETIIDVIKETAQAKIWAVKICDGVNKEKAKIYWEHRR